jgi:hypothetical protein
MPTSFFDDPFKAAVQASDEDSYEDNFISISHSDFQLIQRKLKSTEESKDRCLQVQIEHFNDKIDDLKLELFKVYAMMKKFQKENAALWLENLKLKNEINRLESIDQGPPF